MGRLRLGFSLRRRGDFRQSRHGDDRRRCCRPLGGKLVAGLRKFGIDRSKWRSESNRADILRFSKAVHFAKFNSIAVEEVVITRGVMPGDGSYYGKEPLKISKRLLMISIDAANHSDHPLSSRKGLEVAMTGNSDGGQEKWSRCFCLPTVEMRCPDAEQCSGLKRGWRFPHNPFEQFVGVLKITLSLKTKSLIILSDRLQFI